MNHYNFYKPMLNCNELRCVGKVANSSNDYTRIIQCTGALPIDIMCIPNTVWLLDISQYNVPLISSKANWP